MVESLLSVFSDGAGEWIPDWLHRQAATKPDVRALEHPDGVFTYAQLYRVATALSNRLAEHGIRQGDRVAILARHGLTYAKVLHGVMQRGAILVPLNARLTATEIGWQLANIEASLLVTDEGHAELGRHAVAEAKLQGVAEIPIWTWEQSGHLAGRPLDEVSFPPQPEEGDESTLRHEKTLRLDAVQAIVHTSGTTGNPKGVQITYRNHFWSAVASALQLGLHENDRWLVPMPLFHVGGLAVLMRSLIYGSTAVLYDTFDARMVNDALSDGGITLISVVPTMLQRMLADEGRRPVSHLLRCVLLGGSGASEALLRRCQEEQIPVAQSYGLTEANSQVATLRPTDAVRKLGSSGQPLFPTALRIVSENEAAGPETPGEIWVHSPTVTPGYWNRPDANEKTFVDGWLCTGDIGYMDEEGYLFVLDRRRDLIVSGGENIYPAEIERVLESHPDVVEAGVVGVADEEWGQVPVAYVVADENVAESREALESYCRNRLAGYKVPKHWFFVERLPRNASGKLLRRQLTEWLSEQ